MTEKKITNLAGSVRQRLLNLSRIKGDEFQLVLNNYASERFLYRLSKSEYHDNFILKGAALFTIWSEKAYRATRDIDFLGWGKNLETHLYEIFTDICSQEIEDDGIIFDTNSITIQEIRENQEYGGFRVTFRATLESAKMLLQVDVGFGDAITPEPKEIEYSSMLGFPSAIIKAYPRETVIAEKVHALISLGMSNSRMKDFSDIYFLASQFEFDGTLLCKAIKATFIRRQTKIPDKIPLALTQKFYDDKIKQAQWTAFANKTQMNLNLSLKDVCKGIENFLMPPLIAIAKDLPFGKIWRSGDFWQSNKFD